MRYFPAQYLTEPCVPRDPVTGCAADEICLDEGLCAPQSTELRYCVKRARAATTAAAGTSAGWPGRGGAWC